MNAYRPTSIESQPRLMHVDRDLELDFIREFAAGGELMRGLSVDGRRERIRLAIYVQKLAHVRFREGPMNYAQAYAECFGRPLEMRSAPRPAATTPPEDEAQEPDDGAA